MKPRLPARLSTMHRESLTNEFLSHYAADQKFTNGLRVLVKKHYDTIVRLAGDDPLPWRFPAWLQIDEAATCSDDEALQKFRDSLDELVERWNLHILPDHIGHDATLSACLSLVAFPDELIRLQYNGVHDVPYVAGDDRSAGRTFTITVSGRWNPRNETPGQARTRLMREFRAQLDDELASINDRMAEAGYEYPDDSEQRPMHMRWLYRRVAYREPVDLIAYHPLKPGEPRATRYYVEKRSRDLATELGIKRIPTAIT